MDTKRDLFNEERSSGRLGILVIAFVALMAAVVAFVAGLSMGGEAKASTPQTIEVAAKPEAYQLRCMMTPAGGQ